MIDRLLANARIVHLETGEITEGWLRVASGRIARTVESLGWQPGHSTLPQSFSSC